ncbi:MAG: hypothetical protein J6T35_03235, partial [Bacteroidales bacterium]|nr:hypothetical protein [Bacteroidales bacterium]
TRALLVFYEAVTDLIRAETDDFTGWLACKLWLEIQDRDFLVKLSSQAAMLGLARRNTLVWRRMILDGLSALVYLFKGQKDRFKAVWEAHKEFKVLRKESQADTRESITAWLMDRVEKGDAEKILYMEFDEESGLETGIKARYNGCILPTALRKKENAHEIINKEIRL